jgi:hypothetical protein
VNFNEIPKKTRDGRYRIDADWNDIERIIERYTNEYKLEVNPDFQRGHVWTEAQQIAYIEHVLQGGKASNELRFNCIGWMKTYEGPMVLVDGLQRLTAVRRFLRDEIRAFGHTCTELKVPEHHHRVPSDYAFVIYINDLRSRKDVLQWYLELNGGGTVHSQDELNRVKALLENC